MTLARWMGADLTHWVRMRERPSLAWMPEDPYDWRCS